MDQNDKNNKNRRGNRNLLGAVKLVAWALVLTLVFYCTSSYMGSAGKQASNINIKYSDFIAMMESKQVEDVTVDLSEGLLYIVPKDGYVYAAENGTAYTKSTDQDGKAVTFTVHTDEKTVGDALLKLHVVAGEASSYGLYVKTVNGMTADYDKDGVYWAFYIDGEYAMTGVDATNITDGAQYVFRMEKAN